MAQKTLNVYYFKVKPQVVSEAEYLIAQTKITEAFDLPNERTYDNIYQSLGEVGLYGERKIKRDFVFGTFAFTQTENIPNKQNKNSKITEDLTLGDDDGLGYQTSFLFDKKTNIIAVVNRRPGVNVRSIETFIKLNFDLPNFEFVRIADQSAMDNFLKTSSYRKFKVKIANPTDIAPALNRQKLTTGKLGKLIKEFEADNISFEVTSNKKKSLSIEAVRSFVTTLVGVPAGNVTTMEVVGNDDDVEEKMFNFITYRIKSTISIEVQRHGRFSTTEIYNQLELKFNDHKDFLRTNFSNKI